MKKTIGERVFLCNKHDKYEPLIYYMKREKCSKFMKSVGAGMTKTSVPK